MGNADAVVRHPEQDLRSLLARAHHNLSAGRRILNGVGDQVVQHFVDAVAIGAHRRQRHRDLQPQAVLSAATGKKYGAIFEQRRQVHRLEVKHLPPGFHALQVEEVVDEVAQPGAFLVHDLQKLALLFGREFARQHEFRKAAQRSQRGAQSMAHVVHQVVAQRHQLCLRLLGHLLVMNIGGAAKPLDDGAIGGAHGHRPAQMPQIFARLVTQPVLAFKGCARRQRLPPALQHQRKIIGMHRLLPFPTLGGGRLHSRVVQPALVEIINGAIGPRRPDDLWDRLGQQAKALLALAQRLAAGGMLHKKTDARAHGIDEFHDGRGRLADIASEKLHDAGDFAAHQDGEAERGVQSQAAHALPPEKFVVRHYVGDPQRPGRLPYTARQSDAAREAAHAVGFRQGFNVQPRLLPQVHEPKHAGGGIETPEATHLPVKRGTDLLQNERRRFFQRFPLHGDAGDQVLRLQIALGAGTLLDLALQMGVGGRQLGGALLHPQLQLFLGAAQPFFGPHSLLAAEKSFPRPAHGEGQPSQPVFEDEISYALLQAFDRQFLADGAGREQERLRMAMALQQVKGIHAGPARQPIIGDDHIKRKMQTLAKLRLVLHDFRGHAVSTAIQLRQAQLGIGAGIFHQQHAQLFPVGGGGGGGRAHECSVTGGCRLTTSQYSPNCLTMT